MLRLHTAQTHPRAMWSGLRARGPYTGLHRRSKKILLYKQDVKQFEDTAEENEEKPEVLQSKQ